MGYTLVICEKPDAARRVAEALSGRSARITTLEGIQTYSFVRGGEEFVVCSAQGHAYGVSDPLKERTVYPVFDVEWFPTDAIDEEKAVVGRRISAIRKLSGGASKFVNACDFDAEGETIGHNLLKYACGKEKAALRARFSTLTEADLKTAFGRLETQPEHGMAEVGRARHAIDFMWGVNFSRALSQSAHGSGHVYRTVSIGRVQGPTLGFLVDREREIRAFVPRPYWGVKAEFKHEGKKLIASYSVAKVTTESLAKKVRDECIGKKAVVDSVGKRVVLLPPPVPFDTGGLQKEAYRAFGFPPGRTMQIAEHLYLEALISYPRTGSQKLPSSLNLREIIARVGKVPEYSGIANQILASHSEPVQGENSDPAHPAIHPTGDSPLRPLNHSEESIFDLVARRFLAAFGPAVRRESVDVVLAVGDHRFALSGWRTLSPGWIEYYGRYAGFKDRELPQVSEGDAVDLLDVAVEERYEQRPVRYNPGSLLEKMEAEKIGTKATRADIISTLAERGYVSGEAMEVTDLGFAVVVAMERFAPGIVSTGLTRDIEERLEAVEGEKQEMGAVLRDTVRTIAEQLTALEAGEEELGKELGSSLMRGATNASALGECPICKTGELRLVKSKTSGKRFVGCSNYPSTCRASAPLPQRGTIRATSKPCDRCFWPIVQISVGRRPWRLCTNPICPGRKK